MRQALRAASALVKIHVLRQRIPLFVSWNITFRCNLRCKYCASCEVDREELGTEQVLQGLDALWRAGTRWVTFGGGEPLIREDIGAVFRHAKLRGFGVYLSTNGALLPRKTEVLEDLDHVNVSLDGGREIHDSVRGEGSFDKAVRAIEICKEHGKDVSLQCVVGTHNLNRISEAVDIASKHGASIMFQPSMRWMSSSLKLNPLAPEPEPYRKAIAEIVGLKRKGAPIRNSYAGLAHIAKWPDPTPIWCVGGRLIAVVEADGSMLACHQCEVGQFLNGKAAQVRPDEVFKSISQPRGCVHCWCAPLVELSLLFSLKPEPILNAFHRIL